MKNKKDEDSEDILNKNNEIDESDSELSEYESSDEKSDVPDIENIELANKEKLYFRRIKHYFQNLDDIKVTTMLNIIDGKSTISLRLLDWFITRYANKHKISYKLENDQEKIKELDQNRFNVHISYKAQLKSYRKKYFDPFRRRKKFNYYFDKEKTKKLCTTIGQLNFFRWAFLNNVIYYVEKNYDSISNAMILSNKADKERKSKEKKKLSEDSKSKSTKEEEIKINKHGINVVAKKKIKQNELQIILSFD
jgi:hypothetical protein